MNLMPRPARGRLLPMTTLTCWVLWLVFATGAVAQSQNQEEHPAFDPKTTTRIALGNASGTPGTSVVVPIYFTPAEGLRAGSLKVEVNYVSVNLKFQKVEAGPAANFGDVGLAAEIKTDKNEKGIETSRLTIRTAPLSQGPPKEGIPAGLLGYLTLRIGEDVKANSISLLTSGEATAIGSNTPVENMRTFGATVEVQAPGTLPMVTCFFFTH